MATLILVLDTRRESKDKTYPLVFRIYAGNKAKNLAIGIKLTENQFNSTKKYRCNYFKIEFKFCLHKKASPSPLLVISKLLIRKLL